MKKQHIFIFLLVLCLASLAYIINKGYLNGDESQTDFQWLNSSHLSHFGKFISVNDDDYFSFQQENGIMGLYKSSNDNKSIVKISSDYINQMQAYNGFLYGVNVTEKTIVRINLNDPNQIETIIDGDTFAIAENGTIYYSDYYSEIGLCRIDSLGNKLKLLDIYPHSMQVKGDYLYFIDDSDLKLHRYNLITNKAETISETNVIRYTIKDDKIYYDIGQLYEIDLKTMQVSLFSDHYFRSVHFTDDWIYYITLKNEDTKIGYLEKMKLDGSKIETIYSGQKIDPLNDWVHITEEWGYISDPYVTDELIRVNLKTGELENFKLP